jgi:hypothetical protein
MKKTVLFFLVAIVFISSAFAQPTGIKKPVPQEKGISISAGINLPVGDFSSSHLIGIAVDCSPTRHWFGLLKRKKIAFTYNGGLVCYFGKKETVSSYPYKYPGYIFVHGFGGMLYNPAKNAAISLTAGPALGIYNGNTQFNIGSKLEASYYISKNIAIGPGIILMKESGADPIWAASVKAIFNL